ncbi:hypothetical protein C1646_762297 [Rhizophagus diaphanus]|nr:hypothetical protein C1646_762297 [Rhizophagus diaphanus] [Rhizophagus sp. MUCL 43196]
MELNQLIALNRGNFHLANTDIRIIEAPVCEFDKKFEDEKRIDDLTILRDINMDFIQVLEKRSRILLEELWCFCYENIRLKIWNKRCKDVAAIEEKKLKKADNIEKDEKNLENNIRLVTKDRLIQEITEGKSITKSWGIKIV